MSTAEQLAEALAELIALKEFASEHTQRYVPRTFANPEDAAEYGRRKPLAWAAAREALAAYRSTPADGGGQGVTPLTEEQLWAMRRAAKDDPRTVDEHWFILFARAIEAAHRIGTPASTGGEDRG